jgi:endonuclease/exonuclease/phosphatase family metal-dependent hydrolase
MCTRLVVSQEGGGWPLGSGLGGQLCVREAAILGALRLLTFNCLWRGRARARLAALARWLDRSDVDVACLQEVVTRDRVGLLRLLAPRFPHAVHRPRGPFVLGGLVLLSRWPVRRQRYVVYRRRGRWWNAGLSDRLIGKGLLLTELDTPAGPVAVVDTHLLANYGGDWTPENDYARQEADELRQLAGVLEDVDPGLPLVVAGDLNVPSGTWLLDGFLKRTGLRDAFDGCGEPTWRPAAGWGRPFDIDHVLVRGPVQVAADLCFRESVRLAGGREVPLSDHLGIVTTLTWP